MEGYLQTGIGIIVSVLLFLAGYKQTIGASKERVKAANEKLIETILRRVILERYTPKKEDIKKLTEGKARDYKVKQKDLLNSDQILNTIYTRIFENDLISKEQREENIERLSSLFVIDKKEAKQDNEINLETSKDKTRKFFNFFSLIIAIVSTIIGVSLVSFNKIVNLDSYMQPEILISIIGSIVAIFTAYLYLRIKDNQENSNDTELPKNPYRDYVKFEKEVVVQLRKLNIEVTIPNTKEEGYDLSALINGEKYAIEIKYWKQRPPYGFIKQNISRLKSAMDKEGIKKGLLITNEKFGVDEKLKIEDGIEILSLNELREKLK